MCNKLVKLDIMHTVNSVQISTSKCTKSALCDNCHQAYQKSVAATKYHLIVEDGCYILEAQNKIINKHKVNVIAPN